MQSRLNLAFLSYLFLLFGITALVLGQNVPTPQERRAAPQDAIGRHPTIRIPFDRLRELEQKRNISRHKLTRSGPTPSRSNRALLGALPPSYAGDLLQRDLHLEPLTGMLIACMPGD